MSRSSIVGPTATGITSTNAQLGAKWIGLMHDLLPNAMRFALLVNPRVRANTAGMATDIQGAAATIGLQVEVLYAETVSELETTLASAAQRRAGALMIAPDALFLDRRAQIAALALHHGLPAIYVNRAFPAAGGLMSYGTDWTDTFRQVGVYCGRILKGAKPTDLPVQQATKFHFVINLKTTNRPHYLRQFAHARRRGDRVKRRAFITLLGGAAAASSLLCAAAIPSQSGSAARVARRSRCDT
jgi:putative tryptophan/tyrosine transport system substrate-binding protein